MEKEKLEKKLETVKRIRVVLNIVFGLLFVGALVGSIYAFYTFYKMYGFHLVILLEFLVLPLLNALFLFLNNYFTKKYIKKYQDALLKI